MLKKPSSWSRLILALILFWAILCFTDLLMGDLTAFNAGLNSVVVAQGYLSALRGLALLLLLTAALVMAALLRRGFILAPLIWLVQVGRLAYSLPWQDMVRNLLFVSPALNLALLLILPVLVALLWWQALECIDPPVTLGPLLPSLWMLLALLGFAGSLFTWHWSQAFYLEIWPGGYGAVVVMTGTALLLLTAVRHPWAGLALFFGGLLLPGIACVAIWGGYNGICLAFLCLLPWGGGSAMEIWVGLMTSLGLPLLVVTVVNQFFAWRRGDKFIEII